MNEKTTKTIAQYLADDYPFNIRVTKDFCPICHQKGKAEVFSTSKASHLDSPTSKHEARRKRCELWMNLFENEGVNAIQAINVYVPARKMDGKVVVIPKFEFPILALNKPGEPCKNKAMCRPMCLICSTQLDSLSVVTIEGWTVHDICCQPCGFIPDGMPKSACCTAPALTIPKYFEDAFGVAMRCSEHGSKPKQQPAPHVIQRPSPQTEEKPAASKPSALPKPPPKRKPLKIERIKETGNHDIAKMFWPSECAPAKPEQPKFQFTKRPKSDEANPSTGRLGAGFLYGASKGFDFTPPISLSDSSAKQDHHDEASASAGDGDA